MSITDTPREKARKGLCAFAPYDKAFERRLIRAIALAIVEVSSVGDGVIVLRDAETQAALLAVRGVVEALAVRAGRDGGGRA